MIKKNVDKILYSSTISTCLIYTYVLTVINFILELILYINEYGYKYISELNFRDIYYNKIILAIQLLLVLRILTVIYEKFIKVYDLNQFAIRIIISYLPLILILFFANNLTLYLIGALWFLIIHLEIFLKVSTVKYFIYLVLALFISLFLSYFLFILLIKNIRNIILIIASVFFMYYLFMGLTNSASSNSVSIVTKKNKDDNVLEFDKNVRFEREYSYNHNCEQIYAVSFFGRNAICSAKDFDSGKVIIKQDKNIVKDIPKAIKK